MAKIGEALACGDGQGVLADMQQSLVSSLCLDTVLVFARTCHGARKAAAARKDSVAALAKLPFGVVPHFSQFRRLFKNYLKLCGSGMGASAHVHYNVLGADVLGAIDFVTAWGLIHIIDNNPRIPGVLKLDSGPIWDPSNTWQTAHEVYDVSTFEQPLLFAAQQLVRRALGPLLAIIVKLLKAAHASGRGSGKPQIWTSVQEIYRHVQDSPLQLCATTLRCSALVRHVRVIMFATEELVRREHCEFKSDDPQLLRYLP